MAAIRWNALAMLVRANKASAELGGHIATCASAADLFEVGFNQFFMANEQYAKIRHAIVQLPAMQKVSDDYRAASRIRSRVGWERTLPIRPRHRPGTVEEKVLELQNTKRELADVIVRADNSLIRDGTP